MPHHPFTHLLMRATPVLLVLLLVLPSGMRWYFSWLSMMIPQGALVALICWGMLGLYTRPLLISATIAALLYDTLNGLPLGFSGVVWLATYTLATRLPPDVLARGPLWQMLAGLALYTAALIAQALLAWGLMSRPFMVEVYALQLPLAAALCYGLMLLGSRFGRAARRLGAL